MKKIIFVMVLLLIVVNVNAFDAPKVYSINLNYNMGDVDIMNVELTHAQTSKDYGKYKLVVTDYMGRQIDSADFGITTKRMVSRPIECINKDGSTNKEACPNFNSIENLDNVSKLIYIQYYPSAVRLDLYEKGVLIDEYNLSEFASYCGDGVCDILEQDFCSVDCGGYSDNLSGDKSNNYLWLWVIAIILLIGSIILIIKGKK